MISDDDLHYEQQITLLNNIDFGELDLAGAENFSDSIRKVQEYLINTLVFDLAFTAAVSFLLFQ